MNLTINISSATLDAISAEAAVRSVTCEQVVCDMIEERYAPMESPDPDYDAWFRAMYEEGVAAYERGDFVTNEEVEKEAQARRAKILAKLAARQ